MAMVWTAKWTAFHEIDNFPWTSVKCCNFLVYLYIVSIFFLVFFTFFPTRLQWLKYLLKSPVPVTLFWFASRERFSASIFLLLQYLSIWFHLTMWKWMTCQLYSNQQCSMTNCQSMSKCSRANQIVIRLEDRGLMEISYVFKGHFYKYFRRCKPFILCLHGLLLYLNSLYRLVF